MTGITKTKRSPISKGHTGKSPGCQKGKGQSVATDSFVKKGEERWVCPRRCTGEMGRETTHGSTREGASAGSS